MRFFVWCCLLTAALAQPLTAQFVVQPEAPLDSARASLRDALLVLRDSLASIDAAAARLQRDYRAASAASLLSRARVMHDACARSVRTIPPTRTAVVGARLDSAKPVKGRSELVTALDTLKGVLARCEKDFAAMSQPGQAETVRGYANDRAGRILVALRRYDRSWRDYMARLGIRVTPLGATPPPPAG